MKYFGIIENESDYRIKLESETSEDICKIIKLSKTTKKPVTTFGRIHKDGVYAWIVIPKRKERWLDAEIGNS